MLPTPPTFHRLLLLILLTLTGVGQATAWADKDPLKDLIDGLRIGNPAPTVTWLEVLSKQPRQTTTTLVRVLQEDDESDLLSPLRSRLLDVCAFVSGQHVQEPIEPALWIRHCRLSMEITSLFGGATETHHLLKLLAAPRDAAEDTYNVSAFQRPLKDCLLKACDRDPLTLRVLQRAYGSQTRSLDSQILRTLGDCDASNTPDTLARCLGKRRHFDGIVLTQIASALRKPHLRISQFGLGAVRPMLDNPDNHTRQSAARALAYADDTESIRPLILLLKDPSEPVRTETLKALHRITAMTIEGHPDRWLTWYEEETEWWLEDAQETLDTLRISTEKGVARTLRELASKRLFRRELAPHVMDLLDDPRPEVVRLALATLESLRPPLTDLAPRLKELAHHRSPIVRNDALRILRYLAIQTPQTLPARNSPRPR